MQRIFTTLITILLSAYPALASLTLGQVIESAPIIAKQTPSSTPLHFADPIKFKTTQGEYSVRFFMFRDDSKSDETFGEAVKKTGATGTTFKEANERKGAYFVSTSTPNVAERKKTEVHYTLSIQPEGKTNVMPTLGEVLKHSAELAAYKSSPLTWPGHPDSVITIGDRKYQIRYFYYHQKGNESFADLVKNQKLTTLSAKDQDNGYGYLKVFTADDTLKAKGIEYVISLGEIKE